jgi:hypothetical protein
MREGCDHPIRDWLAEKRIPESMSWQEEDSVAEPVNLSIVSALCNTFVDAP